MVHLFGYFHRCVTMHGFMNVRFPNHSHPHLIQFELNYSLDNSTNFCADGECNFVSIL